MRQEFLKFPRSAKLFLISEFLLAGYFTWPFWFGFSTERITIAQFGVFIAVSYIVGLLAEIPTGAFADSFGRKRSAILGALCIAAIGPIVYIGGNFTAYIIAAIAGGLGKAFTSGSLESMVYELPEMTKETYRRVMVQDTFFFQWGLIVSSLLGGYMYQRAHVLPFVAETLTFVAAAFVMSRISDAPAQKGTKTAASEKGRVAQYIETNKEGLPAFVRFLPRAHNKTHDVTV